MAAVAPLLSRAAWQNLSRDKSDTLLLLSACLLVILPHTSHLAWWTSCAAGAILLWRAQVTFTGQRMPSRWLLLPIAALCMIGVYLGQRSFFGRESGVAMLVLLLALKLLEMRAKRDLFVVTYLALFLILTNFLYSQSIATAAMMALALVVILTAQMSFQYTGRVPPLKQRFKQSAMLLGMAVPLTMVLFVLFPRIQGPLWGMPSDSSARSGLSDSMAPGNVSNLALSEEVAFRVRFFDPPPPPNQRYWRGPVLGKYDGRTWTEMNWRDVQVLRLAPIDVQALNPAVKYQVTLEPSGRRWLFGLDLVRNQPIIDGKIARMTRDFQLISPSPLSKRVRYDLGSVTNYKVELDADPAILQRWLKLPEQFNPRSRAYATALAQKESNPARQVDAILQLFRKENFRYTLQPPLLGQHAVDEFLFDTRAGFCEHYASSFVVLMRMLNIPARVVTGYQGGEINPVDGVMTVRQSDAHAWTEIWLEGRGWQRIDPTAAVAPERIEQNLARALPAATSILGGIVSIDALTGNSSLYGKLRNNLQAISNSWNQWVLDYTPERQRQFLTSLGMQDTTWQAMLRLAMIMGLLVMSGILIPMIRQQHKRNPLDALYLRLEQYMAKRGLARLPHEGPSSWGQRLEHSLQAEPESKRAAIARFLQLYTTQQFAKPEQHLADKALLTTLKSLLKQIR